MKTRQEQQMPTWLRNLLVWSLGAVFVLLPFHAFLSTWGGMHIGPLWLWKSWKEILLAGLFIVTVSWLVTRPLLFRELLRKKYVIFLIAYVALSLVLSAIFASENGVEAVSAGLAMNLRYLLSGVLVYILFRFGGLSADYLKRMVWFLVATGVFVSIIGILQVLVMPADFLVWFGYDKATTIAPYTLIDDNPNLLRAFATLSGPNDFGAFLIMPLLLLFAYARRVPVWAGAVSAGLMLWALILSGSRSAWIGAVVALVVFGVLQFRKQFSKTQVAVGLTSLLLVGVVSLYAAINVPSLRIAIFHSSPGDSSLTEGSTDAHIAATVDGIERVAGSPVGCGIGCAGPASFYGDQPQISENYFVQIAEETGVVGLLLFLVLVGLVTRELYRAKRQKALALVLIASLAGYVVVGLLLHVWADDPLSIFWWMLAGALIGYNDGSPWVKSKSNSRSKTQSSS